MFYGVPFYKNCLNSFNIFCLFPGGITICSTFFEFSAGTCFVFTISSAILFPINSLVASAVLCATNLGVDFRSSSPVLVAVSNNWFPYLLDIFLANDKNLYPLTDFLVPGSIEYQLGK